MTPQHDDKQRPAPEPWLRDQVEKQILDLQAMQPTEEISAILSRRLGISESLIDEIMAGLLLQYRTESKCLRVGMRQAEQTADEASAAVWDQRKGVA